MFAMENRDQNADEWEARAAPADELERQDTRDDGEKERINDRGRAP